MSKILLPNDIAQVVSLALAEDLGHGDVTAALIEPAKNAEATIISRESAVLCGRAWVDEVFRQIDPGTEIRWHRQDGEQLSPDEPVFSLHGRARALLSGERAALNFLQTLSGTATTAHRYAQAVADTPVRILDTRKTIPGLRTAQKYAVRCGGAHNHRIGLFDAFLIKENHIEAAGSITTAVERARSMHADLPLEVEVENMEEFREALAAGADIVMLDNFSLPDVHRAVSLNGGQLKIEVSGNVHLDELRVLADTGIDYISVGALTKHLQSIDFSMRFDQS